MPGQDICTTYDTQRTSQPAKKRELLVEEDGGENGGDDYGERPEWSLGDDGVSGSRANKGLLGKGGEVELTTTIASTKA